MDQMCRTCLKVSSFLFDLFSDELPHKIETISSVQILLDERFPCKICEECVRNVHLLYDFRNIIIKSNVILLQDCIKEEPDSKNKENEEVVEVKSAEEVNVNMEPKVELVTLDSWVVDDSTDEMEVSKTEENAKKWNVKLGKTKVYQCNQCSFSTSVYNLWRNHNRSSTHKEAEKAACEVCAKVVTKHNLKNHMRVHTEDPVSCEYCGKVFKNVGSLRGHVSVHEGHLFQCKVCGKVYKNRKGYTDHRRRHKPGDPKYISSETNLKVKLESVTVEAVALDDPSKNESESDDFEEQEDDSCGEEGSTGEKVIYNCKKCDFTTSAYNLWRNHKRSKSHKGVEKAVCNICGKMVIKSHITHHIRTHTEAPVTCKFCDKQFKNVGSLRGHLLTHKGINYQCTTCGKVYENRKGYSDHMRRHKLGDVKTVECALCAKMFYDKQTLTKHIRSHTGERPYPCEYCKKGFSSSNALKTHIRRHTNEKPFGCDYCDMAFPQRVSLRNHLRTKHADKIVQDNST